MYKEQDVHHLTVILYSSSRVNHTSKRVSAAFIVMLIIIIVFTILATLIFCNNFHSSISDIAIRAIVMTVDVFHTCHSSMLLLLTYDTPDHLKESYGQSFPSGLSEAVSGRLVWLEEGVGFLCDAILGLYEVPAKKV